MTRADCKTVLAETRKHYAALKRIHALPDRWAARGVPPKNIVGSVVDLANHWGLEAESKRSSGSYFAAISIGDVASNIYRPRLNGKREQRDYVLALIDKGLSHKDAAIAAGVSERTVYRWVNPVTDKKYQKRQSGYIPLNDENGTKCHVTGERETPTNWGATPQAEIGEEMPHHDAVEMPFKEMLKLDGVTPEDIQKVKTATEGKPEAERDQFIAGFMREWRAGRIVEPCPDKRPMAGRLAAMDWLSRVVQQPEII